MKAIFLRLTPIVCFILQVMICPLPYFAFVDWPVGIAVGFKTTHSHLKPRGDTITLASYLSWTTVLHLLTIKPICFAILDQL